MSAQRDREQLILQIDAFTNRPYGGNPAAICLLEEERGDDWLQAVAAEMNLSETAYLWREGEAFRLRWFTPTNEVRLCGHATLASAHALWSTKEWPAARDIRFETLSGTLSARRSGEWVCLDFPAQSVIEEGIPDGLGAALGAVAQRSGRTELFYFVELDSAAAVRALQPDFRALRNDRKMGIIVTSRSDADEFDFVSRFFAPDHGIDEDPVTGSAHCFLGPYWAERLGKQQVVGFQASRRGGVVGVRVGGEGIEQGRVELRGQAVTVLRGWLENCDRM
jgi:predicted PhzF superfamily epimerase YddE/YHI9